MKAIFRRIITAKRSSFFHSKLLFEPYGLVPNISSIEVKIATPLPEALRAWLEYAGYGDINDVLSVRSDWFHTINQGVMEGHVIFAQDDMGNFYSFSSKDGSISFISRCEQRAVSIANNFLAFLEEFERRDFNLIEWVNSMEE